MSPLLRCCLRCCAVVSAAALLYPLLRCCLRCCAVVSAAALLSPLSPTALDPLSLRPPLSHTPPTPPCPHACIPRTSTRQLRSAPQATLPTPGHCRIGLDAEDDSASPPTRPLPPSPPPTPTPPPLLTPSEVFDSPGEIEGECSSEGNCSPWEDSPGAESESAPAAMHGDAIVVDPAPLDPTPAAEAALLDGGVAMADAQAIPAAGSVTVAPAVQHLRLHRKFLFDKDRGARELRPQWPERQETSAMAAKGEQRRGVRCDWVARLAWWRLRHARVPESPRADRPAVVMADEEGSGAREQAARSFRGSLHRKMWL